MNSLKTLLSNSYVCHTLGVIFVTLLTYLFAGYGYKSMPDTVVNTLWLSVACYLIIAAVLPKITSYLLVERKYYILPVVVTVFILTMALVFMTRIDYSRSALINASMISFVWFYITALIRQDSQYLTLSALPNFDSSELKHNPKIHLNELSQPYNKEELRILFIFIWELSRMPHQIFILIAKLQIK